MNIKRATASVALALGLLTNHGAWAAEPAATQDGEVQLQLIRNATVKISYADTTFLIDPMLAKKGAYPGFEDTYRSHLRNPLVELPMPAEAVFDDVDAIIVTHTHLDHWDDAAQALLPKDTPLFAQHEADAKLIRSQGFKDVRVLGDSAEFGGVTLSRTGGQHGTDEMFANSMLAGFLGEAMGVVFEAPEHETLYLVGDTIWRNEVGQALAEYHPEVVVANAGYARLNDYDGAIIMGKEDVVRLAEQAPGATVVAVHMDAINHMGQTRDELSNYVREKGLEERVEIPADGDTLSF
ncbi:MBL fold metallo-hydrolase [Oceanimonas pelagia]|uniref:MBL fold metallo-hydrolase n=1 Tax=Oceanimonas pelagia TaxID=3028314 RepID=A0AA50QCV7_9GAMM|nr:MBL fold metallo-hydrolase [Oceanimonas pelagia]WMC11662.1 MBL fold metallo-hydrolase [Oceanimonas pelagia]